MVYIPLFGELIMIDIRQIDDKELIELIELYALYSRCLITNYNKYKSTKQLIDRLALDGALAIGLFKDEKLIGFTIGKKKDTDTFHFTDMYVLKEYRYYVLKLLKASEAFIRPLYKDWVSESHTKEGIAMFNHYKAVPIEVKYYKEL